MPAIATSAAEGRARRLRLIGLSLGLLFLGTLTPALAEPAAGKDWTPQIQVTRRAQIYWESLMRGADADLRSLKRSQRQARKQLKRVDRKLDRAAERRGRAKGRLNGARDRVGVARAELAATKASAQAAAEAQARARAELVAAVARAVLVAATAEPARRDVGLLDPLATLSLPIVPPPTLAAAGTSERAMESDLRKLERKAKASKRAFKKAKRKARRIARSARSTRNRIASLKAAERNAVARRETAERNLGAWIQGMTKYGRIRASKKSKARPGINAPFAWPVHGRLSQTYHAGHDGLDIVRYSGAPIRAAAFGVVTYVGWNPWDQEGRAFVVVITHAGRYETAYGHLLPRRSVRVGQEVKKGEVIGYMGNTGKSTGTHLHFELRQGRATLNPLAFL